MNPSLSPSSRWSAYALIGGSLLLLFSLMHHPGGGTHAKEALQSTLASMRVATGTMHGFALGLILILVAAIADLSRQWSFSRPFVVLGFVFFTFGMLATMVAGTIDGFLIVSFGDSKILTTPENLSLFAATVAQWAIAIQVATKIGIVAASVGIVFFGLELLHARPTRLLGALSLMLAVVQTVVLVLAGTLTPRTIGYAALPLVLWLLVMGMDGLLRFQDTAGGPR